MVTRTSALFVFVLGFSCVVPRLEAQEEGSIRVRASSSLLRRYEPGTWSALRLELTNSAPEDGEGFFAIYLEEETGIQYGRRVWVPSGAARTALLPFRVTDNLPPARDFLNYTGIQLQEGPRGEVIQRRKFGPLTQSDAVVLDSEGIKTATLFEKAKFNFATGVADQRDDHYEMLIVAREASNLTRATIDLLEDFLPPSVALWDALDTVMITSNRFQDDSAGLEALRNWILRGGRAWIMLDRVDTQAVATLLGDATAFEKIDSVELTEFELRSATDSTRKPELWNSEEPVDFVRIFTELEDVVYTVDDWPAAFWQPYGDGEILFTTLGADGWHVPFSPEDDATKPLDALRDLSIRFFENRREVALTGDDIKPVLQEQIGYRIPSREVAGALLGISFLGLLVGGIFLARRQQLEKLVWLVPAVTLATALILLVIGKTNSQSVPQMMAGMQLIRANEHSRQAHASGVGAIYSQQAGVMSLSSDEQSTVLPEVSQMAAETRRLVFEDDGRSEWVNVESPPGSVRFVHFNHMMTLPSAVSARGRLGPSGFEGTLSASGLPMLEDLVLASPPASNLALKLKGGSLSGRAPLARDQFIDETILSDEQRRRQTIYRQLLDPTDDIAFPRIPTVFGWARLEERSLDLPESYIQRQTSLLAIPLRLERTPPDTEVFIPATFVRVDSVIGKKGSSSVFNPRTGRWMEDAMRPTTAELRFRFPDEVRPLRVNRVELAIKINAPSRTFSIGSVRSDGESVPMKTYENPSGVLSLTVEDPEMLKFDERGGIVFSFDVSSTERQDEMDSLAAERNFDGAQQLNGVDNSTWQIDYIRLNATGVTASNSTP